MAEEALHQPAVFHEPITVAHQLIESDEETGFNLILDEVGRMTAVTGLAEPFILIITPPDLFTATRDIKDLMDKGILQKDPGGGRSTSYSLIEK